MNNQWYNENENRMYPVSELVSGTDDSGANLLTGILCDLSVAGPVNLLTGAYLSMLVLTPDMLSISIASPAGGLVVGTWPRPVTPYEPYALEPVAGGTTGYAVFGMLAADLPTGRYMFSGPTQSGLDQRALRMLEAASVGSVARYGSAATKLKGIVQLQISQNLTWRYEGGVIKLGLVDKVQSDFVGPCDKSGVLDQCGLPPLRTMNGVQGDVNGVITLEVRS